MQTSNFINHALEIRFALSLLTIAGLFALAKLAFFVDAKLTALFNYRQNSSARRPAARTACAAASAR